jgi:GTPase Era involved in 16S rRNA processing
MIGKKPVRNARTVKERRGLPSAPTLPVVTPESVLQARSRTILEEVVSPWPATQWTTHDYGMDAVVEILKARDDGKAGHFNTGRRIGVQLKASASGIVGEHVAVQVLVRTLRYWLASHDPFALVFCDVPTKRLFYRWVDDELIAELGGREASWFTRESVTIHIPGGSVLSSERLDELDREARHVVVHRHRVLAAGTYDRLLDEANSVMAGILKTAQDAGFESVVALLASAEARVKTATYVVALAGRMRAGKSTLFNALIRREVSPVGRRPTTAVPVLATAGASDQATVAFIDGPARVIAATSEALAEYATQEQNQNNDKQVRMITVRLVSERLERGIAVLDAPGLFDPSEDIRAITARAIAQANAVLFVIDVSSARSGGFAVESHVLDEIKRVREHSDRVFLLLNKSDELQEADRADVLATLRSALGRDELEGRLAGPPVFISARGAWEWVVAEMTTESPLARLESDLWDYLLRTNSTGVARLENAVRGSAKAIDDALKFISWQRATSDQVKTLNERLGVARSTIGALRKFCDTAQDAAYNEAISRLRSEMMAVPARMGGEMRTAGAVPSTGEIARRLHDNLSAIFGDVWSIAHRTLDLHGREVSERLERALNQVSLDHEPAQYPTLVAPTLVLPDVDLLAPEALGFGALGWLFTMAVAPAYALAGTIASLVFGAWLGREKQLSREIAKVEKKLSAHIRSLESPARELLKGITSAYRRVARHVDDRWAVFEKDAQDQLSRAGRALGEAERSHLDRLEEGLHAARRRLDLVGEEIRWTPSRPDAPSVSATNPGGSSQFP